MITPVRGLIAEAQVDEVQEAEKKDQNRKKEKKITRKMKEKRKRFSPFTFHVFPFYSGYSSFTLHVFWRHFWFIWSYCGTSHAVEKTCHNTVDYNNDASQPEGMRNQIGMTSGEIRVCAPTRWTCATMNFDAGAESKPTPESLNFV